MAGCSYNLVKLTLLLILVIPSHQISPFQSIYEAVFGQKDEQTDSTESAPERDKRYVGDSTKHYEIRTSSLPMKPGVTPATVNDRYMPTLSNGYLATTAYGDRLHLNSLYSGEGSDSHRAAIPAITMARIWIRNEEIRKRAIHEYIFNAHEGTFTETIDCDFAYIRHTIYVHQRYIRVLVSDIYARRKSTLYDDGIFLNYTEISSSPDITFSEPHDYYGSWQVTGRTKTAEPSAAVQTAYVFFHTRLPSLSFDDGSDTLNKTRIMAVDTLKSAAENDFKAARNILVDKNQGSYALLREHLDAWKRRWDAGRIEVVADEILVNKVTTFSQYYLLSSMPPKDAFQMPQHNEVYYGAARTSLAKGSDGRDYRGHRFWDTEVYILPAVVLFHPDIAKSLIRFRSAFGQKAKEHAEAMGKEGFRYPWETGFSGEDVTPDTCIKCREQQLFVSGAVSWAIRQYYAATWDEEIRENADYQACDMTREIARFYASMAEYQTSNGRYHIKNVMGPDDWHPDVDNNAVTNVLASLSIHWARYMACLCNRNAKTEVPDDWVHKAIYLDLPFDNTRRLHYQHDGYDKLTNNTIKQADTILLTYPFYWNMSVDIMRHDLEYYEPLTDPRTPAMTHSFFTVGWKWVNEPNKMYNSFTNSYRNYIAEPFKIWTEYNEENAQDQAEGNVNYLPGAGAFLQSIIYGFAGVRIRPEALEFHNPSLPGGWSSIKFYGFNYRETEMDITIEPNLVDIRVLSVGSYSLVIRRNTTYGYTQEEQLEAGALITIDNPQSGFFIYPVIGTVCEHPRDYIYMPWGYSEWLSAAPPAVTSTLLSLVFPLVVTFNINLR